MHDSHRRSRIDLVAHCRCTELCLTALASTTPTVLEASPNSEHQLSILLSYVHGLPASSIYKGDGFTDRETARAQLYEWSPNRDSVDSSLHY